MKEKVLELVMEERLRKLIKEAKSEHDMLTVKGLAKHLIASGVLVPPCGVGDKVYSAHYSFFDNKPHIRENEVKELLHMNGKWYAKLDDGSEFEVGSYFCKLTREDAIRVASPWLMDE